MRTDVHWCKHLNCHHCPCLVLSVVVLFPFIYTVDKTRRPPPAQSQEFLLGRVAQSFRYCVTAFHSTIPPPRATPLVPSNKLIDWNIHHHPQPRPHMKADPGAAKSWTSGGCWKALMEVPRTSERTPFQQEIKARLGLIIWGLHARRCWVSSWFIQVGPASLIKGTAVFAPG